MRIRELYVPRGTKKNLQIPTLPTKSSLKNCQPGHLMKASREPHKERNKPHNTDRPQFQRSNPNMTKEDLKQITALLNALKYTLSSFSTSPMKWEVTEPGPRDITIEIDCYFQHRAALLQLLLDDFSTLSSKIDGEVLTIR